jgi:hypothetical protein
MSRSSGRSKTTEEKAAEFETLNPLLEAMYKEFQDLSRKKPDGQVGQTKVRMVNRLLKAVHKLLGGKPTAAIWTNLTRTTCRKTAMWCSYLAKPLRP